MGACCSTDENYPVTVEPAYQPSAPGFNVQPPYNPTQPMQQHYPPQQSMQHYPPPPNTTYPPPPPHHHHHQPRYNSGYKWVSCVAGQPLPHTAVSGGRDIDGTEIFVGRAEHQNEMIPAKVIPQKDVAYVCHGGQEHMKHAFEVLCRNEFHWVPSGHGSVPPNAVVAGNTGSGEPLYVGRTFYNGAQTVGKIQSSHSCLYIPFDGREMSFDQYEVLVHE